MNADFYVKTKIEKYASVPLTCELVPDIGQIDFQFETEVGMAQASQCRLQLVEPTREIIKLGMHWQESQGQQRMTVSFTQGIVVGVATFNEKSRLES